MHKSGCDSASTPGSNHNILPAAASSENWMKPTSPFFLFHLGLSGPAHPHFMSTLFILFSQFEQHIHCVTAFKLKIFGSLNTYLHVKVLLAIQTNRWDYLQIQSPPQKTNKLLNTRVYTVREYQLSNISVSVFLVLVYNRIMCYFHKLPPEYIYLKWI